MHFKICVAFFVIFCHFSLVQSEKTLPLDVDDSLNEITAIESKNETRITRDVKELSPSSRFLGNFRSFFLNLRGFAAQAFRTYTFYFPELAFTKCVTKHFLFHYPDMTSSSTIDTTARVLKTIFGQVFDYLKSAFFNSYSSDPIGTKIAELTESDAQEVAVPEFQQGYYYAPRFRQNHGLKYWQNVYENTRKKRQIPFKGHVIDAKQDLLHSYLPPVVTQRPEPETPSIFNFDEVVAQQLGIHEDEEEEPPEDFGKCTQKYVVEVLWRGAERLLLGE